MILLDTSIKIARIELSRIIVTEHDERNLHQVAHYVDLLRKHPDKDTDPIILYPVAGHEGLFTIYNGHHRYIAHIIAGRAFITAILVGKPAL